MGRPTPRWTKKQKQNLLLGIGAYGIDWLSKKTGDRSRAALYAQIRRICGGGGFTRGSYTLARVCRETGYNREQIIRAGKALQQRWARTGKRGAFLLTEDQIDELTHWLRKDYWCSRLHLYGCLRCGTVRKPPRTFGLCARCYYAVRRHAIGLGLPFVAPKLRELVFSARECLEGSDRAFLDLLYARLEERWAPLEPELDRLKNLLERGVCARPASEEEE